MGCWSQSASYVHACKSVTPLDQRLPALSRSFELVKKDVSLRAEHLCFGDGPAHVRIAEIVPAMHKGVTKTVLESTGYGVRD
jgi:hypothetical protein